MIKRLLLSSAVCGLLLSLLVPKANAVEAVSTPPSVAPNGRVVRVDLNGDGRKERVYFRELKLRKERRNGRPFRIRVNGQILDDVWTDSWADGLGPLSLELRPLKRNGRRYLFLGGPYGYESMAFKIYAWQNGKIRPVLRHAIDIDRIKDDGTVVEKDGFQWAYALFPWRLNRKGVFQMVQRPIYPLHGGFGYIGKRAIEIRPLKAVRFYRSPRASSRQFLVPRGAKIVFDGMNARGWLRARYGKKVGWLPGETVDTSFDTFPWPGAG